MLVHRRTVLGWTTIGGLTSLVAECTPARPPAGPAPTNAVTPAAQTLQLPTYVAFQGPTPDQPGSEQGVQPVYVHYPTTAVKSVASPPGKGTQITALTNTVNAPPPPMDQNPAWQAVNQQLGSTLNIDVVAASDYAAKLATVMAGSDLPDLLYLQQGGPRRFPICCSSCKRAAPI
jgi:putative aldouronate transport system substrate-binding protein